MMLKPILKNVLPTVRVLLAMQLMQENRSILRGFFRLHASERTTFRLGCSGSRIYQRLQSRGFGYLSRR